MGPDLKSGILARIKSGQTLVSDGALGTALFENGLKPGDCPELMNLSHPDLIGDIARSYSEAGADIVQTNTFGASPLKLAEYGLKFRSDEINTAAVINARAAVGPNIILAGSCGPSGKILEPYGDGKPQEIQKSFIKQLEALIKAGVDVICVETMVDQNEAMLAIQAVKIIDSQIPVMATMTFDKTPRGFYTIMGVNIESSARALIKVGADIIGSNCGNGLDHMIEIARKFTEVTNLPVIIQSNAGLPVIKAGNIFYNETPEYFAHRIENLIEAGVSIIGGCCGTTPEHIKVIRRAVNKYRDTNKN
ncbi:MAG: homocysteine S-methyltransferase family protein [Candidatus Neomarinimicrobiota bacterium]